MDGFSALEIEIGRGDFGFERRDALFQRFELLGQRLQFALFLIGKPLSLDRPAFAAGACTTAGCFGEASAR